MTTIVHLVEEGWYSELLIRKNAVCGSRSGTYLPTCKYSCKALT
jgi:hypothetical protein